MNVPIMSKRKKYHSTRYSTWSMTLQRKAATPGDAMIAHRRIRLTKSRVPDSLSFRILQMSSAKQPPITPREPPKNSLFSSSRPQLSNRNNSDSVAAHSYTPITPSKTQVIKSRFFIVELLTDTSLVA
jgi:hypothetical protein